VIIRNFQQKFNQKTITISADFLFKNGDKDHIYLQIDSKYKGFTQSDATAFLAISVLPCMKLREDIDVEGTVSKKFLKSMNYLMRLVESWNIGLFKVNIYAKSQMEDTKSLGKNGLFFSGGVDSFYTYLKVKSRSRNKRVRYLVFVHGFDISLTDNKLYIRVEKNIQRIANYENVNVIKVKTNMREMLDRYVVWDYSHGSAMASIALALRRGLANVYFSGAIEPAMYEYGMHPKLDSLWSSEKMKIVHFGYKTLRINKVKFITNFKIARETLRVCWRNKYGEYNCCRCEKCLRTMIHLYVWGALKDFKTFKNDIDLKLISKLRLGKSYIRYFTTALDELVVKNDNAGLVKALRSCIDKSINVDLKTKMLLRIKKFVNEIDIKYADGKLSHLLTRRGLIN